MPRVGPARPAADNVSYEMLFAPPRLDQESHGACVHFTVCGMYESVSRKHHGVDVRLSRRASYRLTQDHYEQADAGKDVGSFAQDALATLQNVGYVLESDWPYDGPGDFLAPVPADLIRRPADPLRSFTRVGGSETPDLLDAMLTALYAHGPVAIGVDWQNDWFSPDATSTVAANPTQGLAGGHEVVAVGYSYAKKAFRVLNSWGPSWADDGLFWLPFACVGPYVSDAYTIVA